MNIANVMTKSPMRILSGLLLSIALSGCGSPETAGIDGTGGTEKMLATSVGTVASVNSRITVNGVEYDTRYSQILIDGIPRSDGDISMLAAGQIVTVDGYLEEGGSTGIAEQVAYHTQVRGPISDINPTNSAELTLTVLGQLIVLHDEIVFGGTATQAGDLQLGDVLQISGFRLSGGTLVATRIDRLVSNDYEVSGLLSQLDEVKQQLTINDLVVDYSQITPPLLRLGMVVEVEGQAVNAAGQLIASSVSIVPPVLDSANTQVELEGFITEFRDPAAFVMDGTPIETTAQTVFVGDNCRSQLALNTKLEVEGRNINGVLAADRVICLIAGVTSHAPSASVQSTTETFSWNDVGATAYRVRLYTGDKGFFYDALLDGDTTSLTLHDLPENRAGFLFYLSTQHDDFWSYNRYKFYGTGVVPTAEITSHSNGDILATDKVTFRWNPIPGAQAYRFKIYDPTSRIVYHEGLYNNESAVEVSGLPTNGADLELELLTQYKGWWSRSITKIISPQWVANAVLTSHDNNDSLSAGTETFTWTDVGAQQYHIRITARTGTGGLGIYHSEIVSGETTSITLTGLPTNSAIIRFNLRTKHEGWASTVYQFHGTQQLEDTELTSHADRDVLSSDTETFSWSEIAGAEAYRLDIKSWALEGRVFFQEDYDAYITQQTVSGLPRNGAEISVSINTKQNGFWGIKRYRLKGPGILPDAKINSHTNYQTLRSSSTTIRWDDVNADRYYLLVTDHLSEPRRIIHSQEYSADITSAVIHDLPINSNRISVSIFTDHDGWWAENGIFITTDIQ